MQSFNVYKIDYKILGKKGYTKMNIISPELQTVKNNLMETHTISNYQKVQKKRHLYWLHTQNTVLSTSEVPSI